MSLELHVAALPFPSYQGTQAAIRSMLEARARAGREVALLTYGAAGYALQAGFAIHRVGRSSGLSLRSGPSWAKLVSDGVMAQALPGLIAQLRPRVIVAHHVEAMAVACVAAGQVPCLFFAHTDLGAELPTYGPAGFGRTLAWAGRRVERALCRRAAGIAVVSPLLGERLAAAHSCEARYVPIPWRVPEPITPDERAAARRRFGLAPEETVALYAGNLDAYQDAERMLAALQLLAASGVRITLLLATGSEPSAFLRRAGALGVAFRSCELGDEPVRRAVHAAADFAVVPRAVAGGLPIKLLDALARGVACAIMPPSAAGLHLGHCVLRAKDHGTAALAAAIAELARDAPLRRRLGEHARAYVAQEHADHAFNVALDQTWRQAGATSHSSEAGFRAARGRKSWHLPL